MRQAWFLAVCSVAAAGGIWVTIETLSDSASSWLDIWATLATMALVPTYIAAFMYGTQRVTVAMPDLMPEKAFGKIDLSVLLHDLPPIYVLLLPITLGLAAVLTLGAFIQIMLASSNLIWTALVTFALPVAGLAGYALGSTPMEQRRKVSIAVGGWMLLLIGCALPALKWSLVYTLEFWLGMVCALIFLPLFYQYYGRRWNLNDHSTEPTSLELRYRRKWYRLLFPLLVLLWGGGDEWLLGFVWMLLLGFFGNMSGQAWRYRPRQLL